jgi:hypothetical protein
MQELRIRFTGVTPLLLHNGSLANPLYEYAREIKKVAGKRKKTDADFEELARLEWFGGLYLDEKERIIIPTEMIEAGLKDVAKRERKGKAVDKALVCTSTTPLDIGTKYKSLEDLWKDPKYRLTIGVRIKGNRVMRTRPRFDTWSFETLIKFDEFQLEARDIEAFAKGACFGDWRPKFGQAKAEVIS